MTKEEHDAEIAALRDVLERNTLKALSAFSWLKVVAHRNSKAKGFWDESDLTQGALTHDPKLLDHYLTQERLAKAGLVASELGELIEGIRKPGPDQHLPDFSQQEVEAADIIIRLLDMAERYEWDLGGAVFKKIAYNLNRPYKHGKLA